jgi:hypothetical protein
MRDEVMKVIWSDAALTFRPETPEEDAVLRAIWVAYGRQLEPQGNGLDEWEDDLGNYSSVPIDTHTNRRNEEMILGGKVSS